MLEFHIKLLIRVTSEIAGGNSAGILEETLVKLLMVDFMKEPLVKCLVESLMELL